MPPQPQYREGEKATAYETPAIMSRPRSRSLQSRRPRLPTTVVRTRAGVSSASPWSLKPKGILRYRKVDCRRAGPRARLSSDAIGPRPDVEGKDHLADLRNSHAAGRAPTDVLRRPVGATCDAIRYRPPVGVRRAESMPGIRCHRWRWRRSRVGCRCRRNLRHRGHAIQSDNRRLAVDPLDRCLNDRSDRRLVEQHWARRSSAVAVGKSWTAVGFAGEGLCQAYCACGHVHSGDHRREHGSCRSRALLRARKGLRSGRSGLRICAGAAGSNCEHCRK